MSKIQHLGAQCYVITNRA